MLKDWSVTHVSEHLLPMSPVYTQGAVGAALPHKIKQIQAILIRQFILIHFLYNFNKQ